MRAVIESMYLRRSVRKFKAEPVEPRMVQTLLEVAMSGPSACNKQPWEFIVLTDEILETTKKQLRYASMNAPLGILVCGNKERFMREELAGFWIQDCAAAVENILLGAVGLKLGATWCGIQPVELLIKRVSKILQLPEHIIPFGLVLIGHPDEEKSPRTQFDETKVHYNQYQLKK